MQAPHPYDLREFAKRSRGELIVFFTRLAVNTSHWEGRIPGSVVQCLVDALQRDGDCVWLDWAGVAALNGPGRYSVGSGQKGVPPMLIPLRHDVRSRNIGFDEKRIFFSPNAIGCALRENRLDENEAEELLGILSRPGEIGAAQEFTGWSGTTAAQAIYAFAAAAGDGWYDSHGNFHRNIPGERNIGIH